MAEDMSRTNPCRGLDRFASAGVSRTSVIVDSDVSNLWLFPQSVGEQPWQRKRFDALMRPAEERPSCQSSMESSGTATGGSGRPSGGTLPAVDVMKAGGWADRKTAETCYQHADRGGGARLGGAHGRRGCRIDVGVTGLKGPDISLETRLGGGTPALVHQQRDGLSGDDMDVATEFSASELANHWHPIWRPDRGAA
jgi:hypothetical protein